MIAYPAYESTRSDVSNCALEADRRAMLATYKYFGVSFNRMIVILAMLMTNTMAPLVNHMYRQPAEEG